jgi:hypothetical protein
MQVLYKSANQQQPLTSFQLALLLRLKRQTFIHSGKSSRRKNRFGEHSEYGIVLAGVIY